MQHGMAAARLLERSEIAAILFSPCCAHPTAQSARSLRSPLLGGSCRINILSMPSKRQPRTRLDYRADDSAMGGSLLGGTDELSDFGGQSRGTARAGPKLKVCAALVMLISFAGFGLISVALWDTRAKLDSLQSSTLLAHGELSESTDDDVKSILALFKELNLTSTKARGCQCGRAWAGACHRGRPRGTLDVRGPEQRGEGLHD